jgi:hypothetical protein
VVGGGFGYLVHGVVGVDGYQLQHKVAFEVGSQWK